MQTSINPALHLFLEKIILVWTVLFLVSGFRLKIALNIELSLKKARYFATFLLQPLQRCLLRLRYTNLSNVPDTSYTCVPPLHFAWPLVHTWKAPIYIIRCFENERTLKKPSFGPFGPKHTLNDLSNCCNTHNMGAIWGIYWRDTETQFFRLLSFLRKNSV